MAQKTFTQYNQGMSITTQLMMEDKKTPYDLSDCVVQALITFPDKSVKAYPCSITNAKSGYIVLVILSDMTVQTGSHSINYEITSGVASITANDTDNYFVVSTTGQAEDYVPKSYDLNLEVDNAAEIERVDNRVFNAKSYNFIQVASTKSAGITLNIDRTIDVSADLTIPKNITLRFVDEGILKIKKGVTLTTNCYIDAGYRQIFDFEDDTASISTHDTYEVWVDRPGVYTTIKPDWFGAKGNAMFNWDTHTASGDNDTKAFKRCMEFVAKASTKQKAGYLVRQPIIVEGRPSATYYVQGNNILGLQSSTISGIHFEFRGNGCVFYHQIAAGDKFIDNFGKLYKSNFKDFYVLPFGANGRVGFFVNSEEQETCSNNEGIFENIVVGQLNYRTGYSKIFNVTSLNMLDNFHIKNCHIMNFDKLYYNTNVEAMGWKFDKCFLASGVDNGVLFHNNCNVGGGFTVEDCEVLFTGANQTFMKLEGQVTEENFKVSCRVETHTSNMTLIDIDGGSVDVRGINMINGSGGYNPSGVVSAKITKTGFVRFTDCMLSENFVLDAKDNDNMYYENALELNNCGYWQSDSMTAPYPIIKFIKPDTSIVSHKDIIASDFSFRKVNLKNHRLNGVWGMAELPITYGGKSRNCFSVELHDKVTGSKITAPLSSTSLPPYINIRSLKLKLYTKNLANVDTVKIIIGSIATAYPDYSVTVNLNTYANGSELLVNKFITSPANKFIVVQYLKGGTQITDKALLPASYLEMQYASSATSNEYQGYDFVHEIALV